MLRRMEASDAILGAASERDASGDARDAAAEKREKEPDLRTFWTPNRTPFTATTGRNVATPTSIASTQRVIAKHPRTIGLL